MLCVRICDWKSGHGGELADLDRVRAIDEVPMSDGGVFAHDQLRLADPVRGEKCGEGQTGSP